MHEQRRDVMCRGGCTIAQCGIPSEFRRPRKILNFPILISPRRFTPATIQPATYSLPERQHIRWHLLTNFQTLHMVMWTCLMTPPGRTHLSRKEPAMPANVAKSGWDIERKCNGKKVLLGTSLTPSVRCDIYTMFKLPYLSIGVCVYDSTSEERTKAQTRCDHATDLQN